jgi:hypothetical protein
MTVNFLFDKYLFWKMCLQGSFSKIMVNNLFVCLYFMWFCSSDSIFCLSLLIFKLFLTSVLKAGLQLNKQVYIDFHDLSDL